MKRNFGESKFVDRQIGMFFCVLVSSDIVMRLGSDTGVWRRWGRHFLPSIQRAHVLQQSGQHVGLALLAFEPFATADGFLEGSIHQIIIVFNFWAVRSRLY